MHFDPIERTAAYRAVVRKAEKLALQELDRLGISQGTLGSCHAFWAAKQEILRDRFDIEWKTPADMNPNVLFD